MDELAKLAYQLHDKDFKYPWTSGFVAQHLQLYNGFSKEIIREFKTITEAEIAELGHRPIEYILRQKLPVTYQALELEAVTNIPERVTFYPVSATVYYADKDLRIHIYYEEK